MCVCVCVFVKVGVDVCVLTVESVHVCVCVFVKVGGERDGGTERELRKNLERDQRCVIYGVRRS